MPVYAAIGARRRERFPSPRPKPPRKQGGY